MAEKKLFNQALKTILILVIICLICSLLLALAKDIFTVSDEEKFNRSMKKIYGDSFQKECDVEVVADDTLTKGTVLSIVKATDGGYVIEVKGNGGYKNGSVTLYVALKTDAKIKGWAIKESVNQSFVSKITDEYQKTWYIATDDVQEGATEYDLKYATAVGATYTSTAINNAINTAVDYMCNHLRVSTGE